MAERSEFRRVLSDLRHGGHVLTEGADTAAADSPAAGTTTFKAVTGIPAPSTLEKVSTPFGYLFSDLSDGFPRNHLPAEPASTVVTALKALGSAMVEQDPDPDNPDSEIPPIYTYWGQFLDHDLTANTDREDTIGITTADLEPLSPEVVLHDLRNLREPHLNLDSVYGNGPAASGQPDQVPYNGDAFELGTPSASTGGKVIAGGGDLPRAGGKALIGDGRNDENLVVAQLHLSFLRFHNAVLRWFDDHPGDPVTGAGDFARARQLTEWHYQWVTVHDFLKRVARPDVVDALLADPSSSFFRPEGKAPFMPLEFSVASFRFGHSMVRAAYDWNENFGAPGHVIPNSSLDLLFFFTGGGGMFGSPSLPENWPAQFERFTGAEPRPDDAPGDTPPRFARRIDTHLSLPLTTMVKEGTDDSAPERIRRLLKRLAVRNLLRGYRLALPTGQKVAATLGLQPLTSAQLLDGDPRVHDALVDGGFVTDTPLWFYVLKEAETLEGGNRLGPVGSHIVADTIIGQLRADGSSFLNQSWDPSQGVRTAGGSAVENIITLLQFAGMHP